MTTRDFTPRLDRQITRTVTTTTQAPVLMSYTWSQEYFGGGNDPPNRAWRRDSDTRLTLSLQTASGGTFPFDLEAPITGVSVSWDGAAASTLGIIALRIVRDVFSNRPLAAILDFDAALPASGTILELGIPGGGQMEVTTTTEVKIWAGRRDYSQVVQGSLITIQDTRYVVRAESGPWAAGDTFTNEDGMTLNVQGVQQLGRQYLELLARSGGL